MFFLSFYNHYWMFLKSKPMLQRRKITTHMLLSKRNLDSILIVSKFNLHNCKYLIWVFGQSLILNIPLLDIEIGHLQGKGQFLLLLVRNFSCHRICHCQNIQKQRFFIFPSVFAYIEKKNVVDIVALFCATLRMKLYNRFFQTLAFFSSLHYLFQFLKICLINAMFSHLISNHLNDDYYLVTNLKKYKLTLHIS